MKKVMMLAALLAMLVIAAVPAIAQVEQGFEQEAESGEVAQEFTVTSEGDNSNQCVGVNGTANTGNVQTQNGSIQYASEIEEIEQEAIGNTFTINEDQEFVTTCEQKVNQAAAAGGK